MTVMKAFAVWLLAALCVGNLAAQEEGLMPSWEVEAIAGELQEEVGEVEHVDDDPRLLEERALDHVADADRALEVRQPLPRVQRQ